MMFSLQSQLTSWQDVAIYAVSGLVMLGFIYIIHKTTD